MNKSGPKFPHIYLIQITCVTHMQHFFLNVLLMHGISIGLFKIYFFLFYLIFCQTFPYMPHFKAF